VNILRHVKRHVNHWQAQSISAKSHPLCRIDSLQAIVAAIVTAVGLIGTA